MNNKFKVDDIVIVNGIGKINGKRYKEVKGIVLDRDTFFKDYNIKFEDGTVDWIDPIYIESLEDYERRKK